MKNSPQTRMVEYASVVLPCRCSWLTRLTRRAFGRVSRKALPLLAVDALTRKSAFFLSRVRAHAPASKTHMYTRQRVNHQSYQGKAADAFMGVAPSSASTISRAKGKRLTGMFS